MNLKVVIGFLALFPLTVYAQPPAPMPGSTLTVYSDNHERFVLVLDGKEQNTVAKDDIKLSNLDKQVYDGKIIFEDKSLPILVADIRVTTPAGNPADAYYNIRRTLDGTIELHFLSVVPVNDKFLTNDVKYFGHKGAGGQFIDYTAPIATKKTTKQTTINGQTVTVTSSNVGFDLSGQPIKDKDVKFVDYSASQAKEQSTTSTTVNSKGETITTTSKKVTPTDSYGNNTTAPANSNSGSTLFVPTEEHVTVNKRTTQPQAIDLNNLGDRQVVHTDVHGDYINIQNSSVTEDKLQNLTRIRDDANGQNGVTQMTISGTKATIPVFVNQPAASTTTTTVQTASTTTTVKEPAIVKQATEKVTTSATTTTQPATQEPTTQYSYSKRGNVTTTTIVTDNKPVAIAPAVTTMGPNPVATTVTTPAATTAPVVTETVIVTPPVVTSPVVNTPPTAATTENKPAEKTSDVKAFGAAIRGAVINNSAGQTKASPEQMSDSKHGKAIKKVFQAVSSYDDNERPTAAPPVSNVDTTIEHGRLVVMVPVTAPGNTPPPATTAPVTTPVTTTQPAATQQVATQPVATGRTTPGVVAMDGNSTAYVNSANYEGYNSDGTRRLSNAPCPNPMDVPSFDEAKADISALPDDGTKLSTAIMLENSYCFTSQQVFELCMLLTAEHSRLEFAKTSYSKTVDPSNYIKVNNAFQDDASVKELKDFLDKATSK